MSTTGPGEGDEVGDPHRRGTADRTRAHRRVTIEFAALVALLIVATALPWVDATTPAMLPLAQALVPYAAPVAATLVGVLAGMSRRWRTAAVAGTTVAVHVALLVPWWVAGEHAVAAEHGEFTVMTSNLLYGRADPHDLIETVRRRDVDVLVLLELTRAGHDRLQAAGLDEEFAHGVRFTREDAGGAAVLSRHPIDDAGVPDPPRLFYEAPVVRVRTPSGGVLVLAAHPVPPHPLVVDVWHRELAAVARWAAAVPERTPLVVAGDLNATDAHPALRRLADTGLVDAHRQVGDGPVATWAAPGTHPLLPTLFHIDRILARRLAVADAGVDDVRGSDHRAAWATFALRSGVDPAQPQSARAAASHSAGVAAISSPGRRSATRYGAPSSRAARPPASSTNSAPGA